MPGPMPHHGADFARFVGVDVGAKSARVVIMAKGLPPKRAFTVPQSAHGIAALLARLREEGEPAGDTLVSMEATGTYWVRLALALHEAGYAVSVVSAVRARAFATQLGIRSKTDDIDAKMLAQLAAEARTTRWQPPGEAVLRLQILLRQRVSLSKTLVREQSRLHALDQLPAGTDTVRQQICEHAEFLRGQLAAVDEEASATVSRDPALAEAAAHLVTFKGFGPITITTLLAETAAFANCPTAEQAVAYAGLDPKQRSSGAQQGKARISKQGSRRLRQVLYFAALRALQHHPTMAERYERLIAAGKPKMAAVIAIARRLLVLAWTLVRRRRDYDPDWAASRPARPDGAGVPNAGMV